MGLFRQKDSVEDDELIRHYTSAFSGLAGVEVIKDLYLLCGMATSTFADADFDPIRAAHRDGMQTVVKRILNYSGLTIYK